MSHHRQGAGPLRPKNFQLLEINIISGQDLEPVSSKMKTYAIAWVHPARKLSSCVDSEGKNNPTWNDKFVFRVNDEFLRKDTSVVMIQIFSVRKWFGDVLVGTVGVLVGNLVPPPARNQASGMRFVALQVRRPSGRPQGILNIGVALLDSSMRSMPLYRQLSASAVGFRNLMDDQPTLDMLQKNSINPLKPILRRSRSERSEFVSSSIIAVGKESSIISISESVDPLIYMKKKGKASSVISGAELREKPKNKGRKNGKASSVLSDSVVSKVSSKFHKIQASDLKNQQDKAGEPKLIANVTNNPRKDQKPYEEVPKGKFSTGPPPPFKGSSILSGSEVGPSPSEVAAVMATRKYPLHDNQSSVLDGWSVDESVEGLKSKLERWRTELPTLYDRGYSTSTYRTSSSHHTRKQQQQRHSDGGGAGLFSCFGNICGYECQCVCGQPPPPERERRGRRYNSPSTLTPGRPYF